MSAAGGSAVVIALATYGLAACSTSSGPPGQAPADSGGADVTFCPNCCQTCEDGSTPDGAASDTGGSVREGGADTSMTVADSSVTMADSSADGADSAAVLDSGSPEAGSDALADAPADAPYDAALDAAAGSLYVMASATPGPSFSVFATTASGTTPPAYTVSGAFFTSPQGLALDPVANVLFVQDSFKVLVFPAGATMPSRTVTSSAMLGSVRGIAADTAGNLYIASTYLVGGVTVAGIGIFGPTAGTGAMPISTFAGNMFGTIAALAVDATGNVYVASDNMSAGYNSIFEFAPNPSGMATPIRTIGGGPNSHIGQSGMGAAMAIDTAGNVYMPVLANAYNPGDAIVVYDPSVTGDMAPTREITGAATKLNGPTTIAVDAAGNLYASNANGGATPITTYAPGATGNVAPVNTLFPTANGGYPAGGLGIAVGP